jgi:16S rRNA C967 or C1407 C5-methylase (RsmB/RsmF family)
LAQIAAAISDGSALLAALERPFARCVRQHPRRGALRSWDEAEPLPWSAVGFRHAASIDPGSRLDYHTGSAYPQDGASQVPVLLLDPQPGEVVVDCCAAPGSKSTQIGLALDAEFSPTSLLVCTDASTPRRKALAENLARQGVISAVVTPLPLPRLAERAAGVADAVLVDAPCSGHERRSGKQVARQSQRQLGILADAARLTRPGGRVVYSTCTPYRAENEDVVAAFLAAHPGWAIEPVMLPGCSPDLDQAGALRLWPQRQGTEPFFACRLRAPGAAAPSLALHGELPPSAAPEVPLPAGVHAWRSGGVWLVASAAAARCALPSQARGLLLARGERADLDPWAAQWLIERGAPAAVVSHVEGCQLWAGAACSGLSAGMVMTDAGAPLGLTDAHGRLRLPSRLRRSALL